MLDRTIKKYFNDVGIEPLSVLSRLRIKLLFNATV